MRNKQILQYIAVGLLLAFGGNKIIAQQRPTYTQYKDNLQIMNPAFVGADGESALFALARTQWTQIEGAPKTRLLSFRSALPSKNIGYGLSVMCDKIGPLNETGFYLDYSYFLKISKKFKMGLGLKGGFSFYRAKLTDLETAEEEPLFASDISNDFLPNFGIGVYVFSDNLYFGISAPRLVKNTITHEYVSTNYLSQQEIHYYLNVGYKRNFNENIQVQFHGMIEAVDGSPLSFELMSLIGLKEQVYLGAMYRVDDSFGLIAQFKLIKCLTIGYSYDFITSELREFQNGSHEITLCYNFSSFKSSNRK